MFEIFATEEFARWYHVLRDNKAKAKIAARIDRLSDGNPGDAAPVGAGVSEMRVHAGPGYRIYFIIRGGRVAILLAGGDKQSQSSDIARAKSAASTLPRDFDA